MLTANSKATISISAIRFTRIAVFISAVVSGRSLWPM